MYCKHLQNFTAELLDRNVTLHIYTNSLKEPIHLTNINLQMTIETILYQILEIIPFDYDQSILKLRSSDEYLHNEDILYDIEYVYNCIKSSQELEFILVNKPLSTFEQFCLNQRGKYFKMIKQTKYV